VRPIPEPTGDPTQWTRAQQVHSWYHHPDYFMPEPYDNYPSHLHIDLLERRARAQLWPSDAGRGDEQTPSARVPQARISA